MSAVISGTNGLLQSYDYQVLTTGFSYTFAAGVQVLVIDPAGTLATGTITMPAAPADGMTITFSSSQQITALTMAGNGASLVGAVTFLPAKTGVTYVYRATGTTWFPTATVPGTGSQLVSGTSVASTSGTSIDFTGIPSWVKRVTAVFSVVSTNGTSPIITQIGAGSIQTTSYSGSTWYANTTNSSNSTGIIVVPTNAAAKTWDAVITAILLNSATGLWVFSVVAGENPAASGVVGGGSKTLSGTLDRIRITTVNGTDTFDAGSINILYE